MIAAGANQRRDEDKKQDEKGAKRESKGEAERSGQRHGEATAAVMALIVLGAIAATFMPVQRNTFEAFGVAVPFCLLFALRMYRVSRTQDKNVAKTVLTDFLVEWPVKSPNGDDEKKSSP